LLGGEPLLNAKIADFMKAARELFPQTQISVTTNGILLPTIDDNFWQTAKETSTKIYVTNYPIKLNKEIIKEKAEFYCVEILFSDELKTMWITPLNIKKNSNKTIQFLNCQHSKCNALYRGKIYKCPKIYTIKYFNKYFDLNFEVTEKDYIDIYNVKSIEQILKNLARPVPFCKNCDTFNISYGHQWKISDKKIEEWVCKVE
jgi:hypothetical protein